MERCSIDHIQEMIVNATLSVVRARTPRTRAWHARFVAKFGLPLRLVAVVFLRLRLLHGECVHMPIHLCWALYLLWVYPTEADASGTFGTSEKHFRNQAWRYIGYLSKLKLVSIGLLACAAAAQRRVAATQRANAEQQPPNVPCTAVQR